jgi:hypothetical protein
MFDEDRLDDLNKKRIKILGNVSKASNGIDKSISKLYEELGDWKYNMQRLQAIDYEMVQILFENIKNNQKGV